MSWITQNDRKPETQTEKYMNMSTEELKKLARKKGMVSVIFLIVWAALLFLTVYYYLPLILAWMALPFLFYLLSRKTNAEIREIGAIVQARKLAERTSREELSAPLSLSDLRKKTFYYKLIWKFGAEKGTAIFVLAIYLPLFIITMFVIEAVINHIWSGSTCSPCGEPCSLGFFIVWMVVLNYFTMKKQAGKLRYHIRKEFNRREEQGPLADSEPFPKR